jgi:hypothetical protein
MHWHCLQDDAVERQHVGPFWFRLAGNIVCDLFLYVHAKSSRAYPNRFSAPPLDLGSLVS